MIKRMNTATTLIEWLLLEVNALHIPKNLKDRAMTELHRMESDQDYAEKVSLVQVKMENIDPEEEESGELLLGAFHWDKTTESRKFWNRIDTELQKKHEN